jgi:hypothetical protein
VILNPFFAKAFYAFKCTAVHQKFRSLSCYSNLTTHIFHPFLCRYITLETSMAIQQVMHLFYCTILWPLWILAVSAAECSYPVHNATSQDGWAPTDMPCTDEPESVCCFPGYACLENKLCQRTPESTDGFATGMLFRGSCTDPIWQSPACPLFCYNDGGKFIARIHIRSLLLSGC